MAESMKTRKQRSSEKSKPTSTKSVFPGPAVTEESPAPAQWGNFKSTVLTPHPSEIPAHVKDLHEMEKQMLSQEEAEIRKRSRRYMIFSIIGAVVLLIILVGVFVMYYRRQAQAAEAIEEKPQPGNESPQKSSPCAEAAEKRLAVAREKMNETLQNERKEIESLRAALDNERKSLQEKQNQLEEQQNNLHRMYQTFNQEREKFLAEQKRQDQAVAEKPQVVVRPPAPVLESIVEKEEKPEEKVTAVSPGLLQSLDSAQPESLDALE